MGGAEGNQNGKTGTSLVDKKKVLEQFNIEWEVLQEIRMTKTTYLGHIKPHNNLSKTKMEGKIEG